MQLKGLKVHFQEDAELMRGAGPCGCLQIVLVPGKELDSARSCIHTHQNLGSPGRSLPLGAREDCWEGMPSRKAAASLVLCFGSFCSSEASGRSWGCQPWYFCEGLGLSRMEPGERRAPALWVAEVSCH